MNLTPLTSQSHNHRILIIDDNPSIHEDFRKILGPADTKLAEELDATEASIFGDHAGASSARNFQIDSAFQGEEGLEKVRAACAGGAPYAVAFVDVRMPPGWDGIETISRIWKEFPDLQIVICTAYSDYSWDEIAKSIGNTDKMLVLKKPFDNVEVLQMAHALSKKWQLTRMAREQMEELDALVNQRTAELRAANARLTGEVAERAAAEEALRCSEERSASSAAARSATSPVKRALAARNSAVRWFTSASNSSICSRAIRVSCHFFESACAICNTSTLSKGFLSTSILSVLPPTDFAISSHE